MNRRNYTVNELIHNQSFRRMVKGRATTREIEKWDKWIKESDQNRAKVKAAVSEITGFEFNDPELPDIERKWSELYSKTAGKQKVQPNLKGSNELKLKWIFRIAAAFLLMSMVGLGVFQFSDDETVTHLEQLSGEKTIKTASDEQKTLRFSNGSKVVLSSNSTLTYSIGLLHDQTIEITLEGEAWFDVESDPNKDQPVFAVATPDGIIRDIGTKFMVTVQKEQSRVVLQEGLVEVEPVNAKNLQKNMKFSVKKGEMVEFNRSEILARKEVNTTLYTSWATGFIEFDQTELQEFAEYVQQRFGVTVQITDPDLTDVTLDGAVYFRSLEGLIRSISNVTAVPVYQSDNRETVYIGNPNGDGK